MNIFRTSAFRAFALSLALPLSLFLLAGCDVESADSTTAVASDNSGTIYNFAGLYVNPNNGSSTNGLIPLVFPPGKQSGTALTWLRLLQYGTTLEAYDNAGLTWSGSISALQSGTATFSLVGRTTAGAAVEIAGTLVYADQNSTMDAAWIEPAFSGSIMAKATVSPATTNSPVNGDVSLTVNDSTVSLNDTVTFTASGGTGSYSWPSSVSYGTFSGSGSSASYTRTSGSSGNSVTVTVTSGGDSDSVTLTFN